MQRAKQIGQIIFIDSAAVYIESAPLQRQKIRHQSIYDGHYAQW